MEKQTPMVIVTENPCHVEARGTFGGGYSKPSSAADLVKDATAALVYEQYGRRQVRLIAPAHVRQALREQGFEV